MRISSLSRVGVILVMGVVSIAAGCSASGESASQAAAIEKKVTPTSTPGMRTGRYQALGYGAMRRVDIESVSMASVTYTLTVRSFNDPEVRTLSHLTAPISEGSARLTVDGCQLRLGAYDGSTSIALGAKPLDANPDACEAKKLAGIRNGDSVLYPTSEFEADEGVYVNGPGTAALAVVALEDNTLQVEFSSRDRYLSYRDFQPLRTAGGSKKTQVGLISPSPDCDLTVHFDKATPWVSQVGPCLSGTNESNDFAGDYTKF